MYLIVIRKQIPDLIIISPPDCWFAVFAFNKLMSREKKKIQIKMEKKELYYCAIC